MAIAAHFTQVLIIHQPGRKQANLAVLLNSILENTPVELADSFTEGLEVMQPIGSELILVGANLAEQEIRDDLIGDRLNLLKAER